jgi:transposase
MEIKATPTGAQEIFKKKLCLKVYCVFDSKALFAFNVENLQNKTYVFRSVQAGT